MEAIGETGEGGFSYPIIQGYINRCGTVMHHVGGGKHNEKEVGGDSDFLQDFDSDGSSDFEYGCDERRGPTRWRSDQEGDAGWASFSWDEVEDDSFENCADLLLHTGTRRRGLVRSRHPPRFVRTAVYFAELLALGNILYAIYPGVRSVGGGGFSSAANRACRQATSYCLTVVRMCCNASRGGLEKVEPAGWVGGRRELDEDTSTLQRTQLLVDARLAEKLAPCLHDIDFDVRRDAVSCALWALRGGHARLQWTSISLLEAGNVDPHALLALDFCTPVWVSAFVSLIRGRGVPALGSTNPSRLARDAEESKRRLALQCLAYMAEAGDLATHNWRGLKVISSLLGALNNIPPGADEPTSPAKEMNRKNSGVMGLRAPDFRGWKEGVLDVFQKLTENGFREGHSVLRAQSRFGIALEVPGFSFPGVSTLKSVASRATELLRGGTLDEISALVRRARSVLATAVRIRDHGVLGSGNNIPEDVRVTLSLVWGWMQRVIVQLTRDEPDHPSTSARVSLAWDCLQLMRFILSSVACRFSLCKIHPDLTLEVSHTAGGTSSTGDSVGSSHHQQLSTDQKHGCTTKSELAEACTGLETVVLLLSAEDLTPLDLYRAHPIPPLCVGAADVLADALTYGDKEVIDSIESYELGLRLGLAVQTSANLVRESHRLGVEHIHLLWTHPAGRTARVKLLDRVLWQTHRGLHEQIIVSGLVEFVVCNMLPDCAMTEIISAQLPASFVRHNGTPLVRNEGIALLERVVAQRLSCPAVARETARQAVRHGLPSGEYTRLRHNRHTSIRAGVGACLRCLARLDSPPVDNALTLAGVPRQAILYTRRDHIGRKTRQQWARWLRREESEGASSTSSMLKELRPVHVVAESAFPGSAAVLREKFQMHSSDASVWSSNGVSRSCQPGSRKLGIMTRSKGQVGIDDHNRAQGLFSTALPPSFRPPPPTLETPSPAAEADVTKVQSKKPVNDKDKKAVLTIEGGLSTLSVPSLLVLLAAELAVSKESMSLIEVGGSFTGGCPADRQARSNETASTTFDEATLELSLPDHVANQLYTRCLAGVLRIPGLLFLEVRVCCSTSAFEDFDLIDQSCFEIKAMQISSSSHAINVPRRS